MTDKNIWLLLLLYLVFCEPGSLRLIGGCLMVLIGLATMAIGFAETARSPPNRLSEMR